MSFAADRRQSFNQQLLWVKHDPHQRTPLRLRKDVFVHVQSRYRPWKRAQDARKLRASVKVPSHSMPPSGSEDPGESNETCRKESHKQPDALATTPLLTAVTQSKRDPFPADALAGIPIIFFDFSEYVYRSCERMNQFDWRREAANHPAVNHATLMTIAQLASSRMTDVRLQRQFAIQEMYHKQRTLELVRREICEGPNGVSDSLIIAVLILAVHDGTFNSAQAPEVHPTSQDATDVILQDMGRACPRLEHAKALLALIKRKGGTKNVQFRGIDQILLLLQFVVFAWHDVRLMVPLVDGPDDCSPFQELYSKDARARELLAVAGTGFDVVRRTPGLRWLHEYLMELRDLTVALDQFYRSDQRDETWQKLVFAHGIAQQHLLYLPERKRPEPGPQGWSIYRICLLSALLFSDMIISPLPIVTGLKPRLASELINALDTWGEPDAQYQEVVLWAVLLGCIAATYSDSRAWFLAELRRRLEQLKITTYVAFKRLMVVYLWYDPVLDHPAFRAWSECRAELGQKANGEVLRAPPVPFTAL